VKIKKGETETILQQLNNNEAQTEKESGGRFECRFVA
jgi:hypothetical protein